MTYVPLRVNRFQKIILLIVQYKYFESCSGDFILQNLILRTRSCSTGFITQSSHEWSGGGSQHSLGAIKGAFSARWFMSLDLVFVTSPNILEFRLSPEIPSQIDWNLKIQNTTFLYIKFLPQIQSPLHSTRGWVLHFQSTIMVGWKCFVPSRYMLRRGISGGPALKYCCMIIGSGGSPGVTPSVKTRSESEGEIKRENERESNKEKER